MAEKGKWTTGWFYRTRGRPGNEEHFERIFFDVWRCFQCPLFWIRSPPDVLAGSCKYKPGLDSRASHTGCAPHTTIDQDFSAGFIEQVRIAWFTHYLKPEALFIAQVGTQQWSSVFLLQGWRMLAAWWSHRPELPGKTGGESRRSCPFCDVSAGPATPEGWGCLPGDVPLGPSWSRF